MSRDWFWQLQADGHGPDWFFFATFAPAGAERLSRLVREHPLPAFAQYRATNRLCRRHHHTSTFDLYVDQANYAGLVANLTGEQGRNIWIYHTIEVCGADITIERGYGGYPGAHGAAETGLIATLARSSELALTAWQVGYGGEGYTGGSVASGASAAELLAYVQASYSREQ